MSEAPKFLKLKLSTNGTDHVLVNIAQIISVRRAITGAAIDLVGGNFHSVTESFDDLASAIGAVSPMAKRGA
jgi:hypothetical protein